MSKKLANSYFQFKQFRINQDKCAMKVCTDACIQGALAANEVMRQKPTSALDIGCGTGLLGLMLAQNYDFTIQDAVEINSDAAQQAGENLTTAIFNHQIRIFQEDIRKFQSDLKYDFIICNPPFYENALKSPSTANNQAMHNSHLSYGELAHCVDRFLSSKGVFCVLLPFALKEQFQKTTSKNLSIYRQWNIRHSEKHHFFRTVLFYRKTQSQTQLEGNELTIRTTDGGYTALMKQLLNPYYLNIVD